jgi:hypothetical protein
MSERPPSTVSPHLSATLLLLFDLDLFAFSVLTLLLWIMGTYSFVGGRMRPAPKPHVATSLLVITC